MRISADSFRFAVDRELGWNTLRSDRYQVRVSNGRIAFEGSGSGTAWACARSARSRWERTAAPIAIFWRSTIPARLSDSPGRGLSWQRLTGDSLAMLTTQPDQDRAVLAAAERIERTIAQRTHWPAPPNLELRVYPTSILSATPRESRGGVAAHTEGRRIALQPSAVLRAKGALDATLTHELAHAFVESQAAAVSKTTPLWFREGLTGVPSGRPRHRRGSDPPRTPISSRPPMPRAPRLAYAQAPGGGRRTGAALWRDAVLDWVKRGLPAEVANASASQAAPKSK